MQTDDLIALMAADARKPVTPFPVTRRIGLAAFIGAIASLVILVLWLGVRDMAAASALPSYWMKTLYTSALAGAGFLVTERLCRPGAKPTNGLAAMTAVFTLMLGAAVFQLMSTSEEGIGDALLGSTWNSCPWRIAALATPGLFYCLLSMRRLAPTRPAFAGASAGLFVGGIAATVYGLYCTETSAAFTLIWYTCGIALCAAVGAVAGWRLLRW